MIFIIVVSIIVMVGFAVCKLIFHNYPEKESESNLVNEIDIYDQETIDEIKEEINATADTDMYQIQQEYDGRQILQIKPSIQFETVLAGILKHGQPAESEIQDLLKKMPTQKGVWITPQSRDTFLTLLKDNAISGYAINEEGYLYRIQQEMDKQEVKVLTQAIQSNQLYMIDISGFSYTRDDFSGEIVEYPFEKMDPYQVIDSYQEGNVTILEVTTNEKGILTKQEILQDILLNIQN